MSEEMARQDLEIGDIISLDDENGEELGDFEVIAVYELDSKQYVALTQAIDEDADDAEIPDDEHFDVFILRMEDGELSALDDDEEQSAYQKLREILDDVEFDEES